jgi:outer membrane lipopolysaccharide assembly protein LptE/RlpB
VNLLKRFILLTTLAVLLHGCGYSLAVRNTAIPSGQSVDVRMFTNRTFQPDIEADFRQALVNELLSRGEKIRGDSADFVISGEIVSLSNQTTAFSAVDQAMFYTLVLQVQGELTERRSGKVVWKGTESVSQGYPVNSDLGLQRNAHSAAVSAACAKAARLLVVKMNQSF